MLTLFLTLSHASSENVCCQSWRSQPEHAARKPPPNVPARRKHVPSASHTPLKATPRTQIRGPKMAFEEGEHQCGKELYWPLAIQLQTPAFLSSGQEEGEQITWPHFIGLQAPKSLFPGWWQWLPGTVVPGQSSWGKRVTVAQWESCGPQSQPRTQSDLASAGSQALWGYAETPQEEKQGLDLPCKLCSVTYVTGQDCCCFSNHYSNDYIPSD